MSDITKHLGQRSEYKSTYDSSLLVREPRQANRTYLGLQDDDLPFVGYDIWNAYEVSMLLSSGLPVNGVAKVMYSSDSKYIVESKSIKLYFNSFNMEKRSSIKTARQAIKFIEETASKDLSKLLETNVWVSIFDSEDYIVGPNLEYPRVENVESVINNIVKVSDYSENPKLLKIRSVSSYPKVQKFSSGLLKSNCKVTSQPDWGDVYVHIKGTNEVDYADFLRYIISFRDECHFHEEICEAIYKRLYDTYKPEELLVFCYYVRRGGIDINPIRASNVDLIDKSVIDTEIPFERTGRQ